jgi:hypothetical protein
MGVDRRELMQKGVKFALGAGLGGRLDRSRPRNPEAYRKPSRIMLRNIAKNNSL